MQHCKNYWGFRLWIFYAGCEVLYLQMTNHMVLHPRCAQ